MPYNHQAGGCYARKFMLQSCPAYALLLHYASIHALCFPPKTLLDNGK